MSDYPFMIRDFFTNGKSLLKTKQTSILSAAFIMMAAVFISRILGLIRDRLLAYFFSPYQLGIYFTAFRIPDMLFSILVMGALSTAFIPVITNYLVKEDRKEAWKIASSVINIGLILFSFLALVIFIFSLPLSTLIAPGFNNEELLQVSSLTRIMLFAQFFFIISNFLTGILQAEKRFFVPALAPIIYNLGIILGIFILAPFLGLYGPTIGVLVGAFFHFLIQLPLARELGFSYKLKIDLHSPGVVKIGRLMFPRTIGLIASQINFTFDNILASLISPSAITIFNFASHLQQLPIGLFGATIAQAALPTLSETKTKDETENFKNTLVSSLLQILFLTIPATVILIVLRIPLVRLVFGAVKFDWNATILTGLTLACFSLGVIFQSVIHLFARAFYSLHDSKTPLFIGLLTVFVNIFFSFILVYYFKFPIWGLAASSSLADFLNANLLFVYLTKKVPGLIDKKIGSQIAKITLASLISGLTIYLSVKVFDLFILDTTRTVNLLFLTLTSFFLGITVFILFTWWLKIEELFTFAKLVGKLRKISSFFKQPAIEIPSQEQTTP